MKTKKRNTKNHRRYLLLLTLVLCFFCTMTAYAATEISKIRISANVDSDNDTVSEPELSSGESSKYSISDIEWSKDFSSNLKAGSSIKGTLRVIALEGYEFDTSKVSKSSYWNLPSNFTYSSSKMSGNEAVLTFYYYPTVKADMPENLRISNGYARWDAPDNVSSLNTSYFKYEIKIYNNTSCVKTDKTASRSYNMSSYINKNKEFYFKVRVIRSDNYKYIKDSDWAESEHWDGYDYYRDWNDDWDYDWDDNKRPNRPNSSSSGPSYSSSITSITWVRGSHSVNGVVESSYWRCYVNGRQVFSDWVYDNGLWYYINDSGNMFTGWIFYNNEWYYLSPTRWRDSSGRTCLEGSMMYYTWTPDGYWVNSEGKWR